MAFGPSEWVNTRPQLNPEGVPETRWEYALRGSRGIEHRAGLPPGLRTPVGDLLEERHAVRAPTRQTSVRSDELITRLVQENPERTIRLRELRPAQETAVAVTGRSLDSIFDSIARRWAESNNTSVEYARMHVEELSPGALLTAYYTYRPSR